MQTNTYAHTYIFMLTRTYTYMNTPIKHQNNLFTGTALFKTDTFKNDLKEIMSY